MATNKYNKQNFAARLVNSPIDVFITSSSFEERCFVVPEFVSQSSVKRSIVFYNENEVKQIITNAASLAKMLPHADQIPLNSDDPISNYARIDSAIVACCENSTRPNILIDSTTFTHENLLILLRLLSIRFSRIASVYFSYVGAQDYSTNTEKDEDKWLSKGIREIRTVLGYPGFTDPTEKNHLMILFGFESERTRKIIEEYEFENVTLGFADLDQSIQSNHYKINLERHQKLMAEYPNAKKFIFSLTDPQETKAQIINYLSAPSYKDLNTVIAPLNNKISTIGAGLAAIENKNIQIAYAKPNIYNTRGYSIPNNDIYFFEIRV